MRSNFSQRAIYIQVFLAYFGVILVQRLGWELAGWFSESPHWRNFTENLLGVVFVILIARYLKVWEKIYWLTVDAKQYWYLFVLPLAYVSINISQWYPHSLSEIAIGSISTLFTGILEEVLCRGIVVYILLCCYVSGGARRPVLKAAFFSALSFGIVHLVNVFEKPDSIGVIIGQVIYATFIGMGFAACYLRTRSLIPLIVIHILINWFSFMGHDPTKAEAASFIATVPAIIVCFPLFVYGVMILYKSEEAVLKRWLVNKEVN